MFIIKYNYNSDIPGMFITKYNYNSDIPGMFITKYNYNVIIVIFVINIPEISLL
jgi:hypothetical protein